MIELRNVRKRFGERVLFENFSLLVKDGEFIVLAGKSGSGKTTLLNMIGGLEKPDSGEVLIDGQDIYKIRNKKELYLKKLGFLFQNFALLENKTVRGNLAIVRKNARSGMEQTEALSYVGLADKADEQVYKLSGGEQQRVALARLIYKKCDIILTDEPTGSLDSGNAEMVLDLLHKLNGEGKTVILVTHSEKIIESEGKVIRL